MYHTNILIRFIYKLEFPKRRKDMALKLLNGLPRKFRNGSYMAAIEVSDIMFHTLWFDGGITCRVKVKVRLRKRKNGNRNLGAWTAARRGKLYDLLYPQYFQKLKYLGVETMTLELFVV